MCRPLATVIVSTLVATLALLSLSEVASADARYLKSNPPPDSVIPADIRLVHVVFSEGLKREGSFIEVTGPDGTRADKGDSRLDAEIRGPGEEKPESSTTMWVSLKPALRPGKYTVKWSTVSAVDGQRLSDSFSFYVTPLLMSSPAAGSDVKGSPSEVRLTFSERLSPQGSTATVNGDDGVRVDQGNSRVEDEGKTMRVLLKPNLTGGKYSVRWTAALIETGESASGSFGFTVHPWQASAAAAAASPPDTGTSGQPARALPKTGDPSGLWPVLFGIALLAIGSLNLLLSLTLGSRANRRIPRCAKNDQTASA